MKFISPKIDYVFKKVFGSPQSTAILISFLNAILYQGEKTIQSLTIINPYNPGKLITLKETYVDVKAVLADGSIVIIEMQIGRVSGFSKRVMYNLAKAYANQLTIADAYSRLNRAIAVTITDFTLVKDENSQNIISEFVFYEKNQKFAYPDDELKLFFVELPKFEKSLEKLETLTDKWLYFLKEAARLESIPEALGCVAEIESALNLTNQANMSPEEFDLVERRAMALQDERGKITYATEQGRAEGRVEGQVALIMRLLNKRFGDIPIAIAIQIEALSIEQLESLAEAILDFDNLSDLENWLAEIA